MKINSDKYLFSDFTFSNYRNLLRIAKNKYRFVDYCTNFEKEDNFAIWRHDIEFSVSIACTLASIEKEESISSTYFVQIHSEFYNTMEKKNVELIKEKIINNGHNIGLHFDSHFYNIQSQKELEKFIIRDKKILEELFDISVYTFSFHNTNSFILSCEDEEYGGLINVYSKRIKSIPYCTDSLGYWRFERLQDRLEDKSISKIHVLTHDGMWSESAMAPRQRVIYSINKHTKELIDYYDNYLKRYGHKNIDDNGDYSQL